MIPQKLSYQLISNSPSLTNICNLKYRNYIYPLEIYSTNDIELNNTSFLTFQVRYLFKCTYVAHK